MSQLETLIKQKGGRVVEEVTDQLAEENGDDFHSLLSSNRGSRMILAE